MRMNRDGVKVESKAELVFIRLITLKLFRARNCLIA